MNQESLIDLAKIYTETLNVKRSFYTKYGKRTLDIILSGVAIILLSWLFLIIAILELIFHGFPIIYKQERPGKEGKIFNMYKFRSMTNETDVNGDLLPGRDRITKFGRFIRRCSLDELPELFCIFTGKMSIIGPRPLLPEYLQYYTERHKYRHAVRPGLALVSLRKLESWTWNDQFETDIWYVENCSLWVDIKMIFAILKEAVKGSEYRVNATRGKFTKDYWREEK